MNVRDSEVRAYTSDLDECSRLPRVSCLQQGTYICGGTVVCQLLYRRTRVTSTYPPTSTTRTSLGSLSSSVWIFASKAAPLALFVGPEEKQRTGYSAAVEALLNVPSLSVMYSLHFPNGWTAYEKPAITCRANRRRLALRMLAFSRSRYPSRPIAYEQEMS